MHVGCDRPAILAGGQPSPLDQKDDRDEDPGHERLDREPVKGSRRYGPPKGGGISPDLRKEREESAGKHCQPISGHAAAEEYLADRTKIQSSECSWCGSGERQTRRYLSVKCRTCP